LHGDEDIRGEGDLKDVRKSPLPGALNVAATEVDPGANDQTKDVVRILKTTLINVQSDSICKLTHD
jgi:hypothetical protein